MRKFKTRPSGFEVDLDDPKTYDHLPKTSDELDGLMFENIGYALVYMDYFPDRKNGWPKEKQPEQKMRIGDMIPNSRFPDEMVDMANTGWEQRQRIEALIKNFAENRRKNYNNVEWLREQVFLFEDETENMC